MFTIMRMKLSELRGLIREELTGKRYWGRGGAGIMFMCSEDDTILLLKRAGWVAQGGTWGVAGGAVEDGWVSTPIVEPITDRAVFVSTALREAEEECGSLPPGFSMSNVVNETTFEDQGFRYVTFVADIAVEQKEAWDLVSNDGETSEFRWFPRDALPGNLHFGVKYTLSRM